MRDEGYTELVYGYRDGANYQAWTSLVCRGVDDGEMEARIRAACESGERFVAAQVGLEEVFLFDEEGGEVSAADHGWHEFVELRRMEGEPEGAGDELEALEDVAERFEAASREGWKVEDPRESVARS